MNKVFLGTIRLITVVTLIFANHISLQSKITDANDREYIGLGISVFWKDFARVFKDAKTVSEFVEKGEKYANEVEFNRDSGRPIGIYPSSHNFVNELEVKFDSILVTLNKIDTPPVTTEPGTPGEFADPDPEVRLRAIKKAARHLSAMQLQFDERAEIPERLEIIIGRFESTEDGLREIERALEPLARIDEVVQKLAPYFGPFDVWFNLDRRLIPKSRDIIDLAKNKRQILIPYLENRKLEINNLKANLRDLIRNERVRLQNAENALQDSMRLLEENARSLNDHKKRIEDLQDQLQALMRRKAELERSIQATENDIRRRQNDLNRHNAEWSMVNGSIGIPFEQSDFRCPQGNAWASCQHTDHKNRYTQWQEGLRQRKSSLEGSIRNLNGIIASQNQRLASLFSERDATNREITSKSGDINQEQARYENNASRIIEEFIRLTSDKGKLQTERFLNSYYDIETQLNDN